MLQSLQIDQLTLHFLSSPSPLFENLSICFSTGWTGVVGANGVGKSTLLRSLCQSTGLEDLNISGSIQSPPSVYYCAQSCDSPPVASEDFLTALYEGDNSAGRLMGILGLDYDWYYRWDSLSFGERKRFQIALALWLEPELLAVDEPSNHLDEEAREFMLQGLRQYKGIGLLVSHDRNLLDQLCSHTLFLKASGSELIHGGVTQASEEMDKIRLNRQREYRNARDQLRTLQKEAASRRDIAASQQSRRSKKGIPIKDHDARFKKNLARISGKDGTGGKLLRQMDGRISQARDKLDSLNPERRRTTGITIETRETKRDLLFRLDAQDIPMGDQKILRIPPLLLTPGEKVSLRGANGSGKSTLLRRIQKSLMIPQEDCLWIPQELSSEDHQRLLLQLEKMDKKRKGEVLSTVNRLGSDPERLLDSRQFSPGEARKILLALGIINSPQLIVLDEPTNHMDLPSIQALEDALKDLESSLILVSHDRTFRDRLCRKEWHILRDKKLRGTLSELHITL